MSTFNELIDFTRSTTGTYLDSVVYGEELVTNGTFDNNLTGWTTGSNVTSVYYSGAAQLTLGGALTSTGANWFSQSVFETGKRYFVTFDATYVSGGSLQAGYGYDLEVTASSSGTYSFIVNPDIGAATLVQRERVTFAGASGAVWRIDNVSVKEVIGGQVSGTPLLRTAAINEPRLEYDASGNPLGLLIEEARTNLLLYSNQANQLQYHVDGVTTGVDTTEVSSPEGGGTVIKLNKTAVGYGFARVSYGSVTNAQTLSAFVKKGTARYFGLRQLASTDTHTTFDLETNTWVQTAGSTSRGYEDYGNGWLRLWVVSDDSNSKAWASLCITNSGGTENNYETGTVYVYGIQRETGAFPTSYIPTSGSTVTRAADLASLPVERFAYNQSKGSVVATGSAISTAGAGKDMVNLNDGTNSNYMQLNKTAYTDQTRARFLVNTGNTTQAQIYSAAGSVSAGSVNKQAGAFQKNDFAFVFDGSLSGVDTSGEVPPVTTVTLGALATSQQQLNGHIKQIQYYPKRLSNTELQLLTQPSASPTMNLTFDGQATSTLVEGLHD